MMRVRLFLVFLLALVVYLLLGAANLHYGNLNQDEGWYLYTAGEMALGRVPYRDFAFTQGPVMPAVYRLASPLVATHGVAAGRLFTGLLGLLTTLLAATLAARLVARGTRGYAFVFAFVLIGVNVYQSYFTTIVKTYSLCALFLVMGLLLLSFCGRRGAAVACFLAGVFLALAAGVRLSAGVALPVAALFLLAHRNRWGHACWVAFTVGGAAGLCVVFLPLMLMSPQGVWFGLVEYHAHRAPGGLNALLTYKAGFVSRIIQAYTVPVLFGVAWLVVRLSDRETGGEAAPYDAKKGVLSALLWWVAIAVTLVHFSAPFPYDDYQVIVMPTIGAALTCAWVRVLAGKGWLGRPREDQGESDLRPGRSWAFALLLVLFMGSTAAAISSPLNQEWFVLGRDRIWWQLKQESDLQRLRRAADMVESACPGDEPLLTQDTYLAVEAGRRVPPGLEMGPFSYFPGLSTERATALHVMNEERLVELLRTTVAPVAAFSGYGLSMASPGVVRLDQEASDSLWALLLERYEEVGSLDQFGQAHTTLTVLTLKPELDAQPE